MARWTERTELPVNKFVAWLGVGASKFYAWRDRYGKVNEHNAAIPRDTWLEDWEKQAVVAYHERHPLEGYRRLTFMMLDEEEAQRHVTRYVTHYNQVRLHSAIGYVTPEQKLAGMEQDIFEERDRKLAEARQRRAEKRREAAA